MTIICAMHRGGETWIAGDSRTSQGSSVYDHTMKWIVAPDGCTALGIAGSSRARYLMERCGAELFFQADAHTVSDRLHRAIRDDGWPLKSEDGGPKWIDGGAIYANAAGVWGICCDFTVHSVPDGVLLAEGSGRPEARGAAFALMHRAAPTVEEVLRIACEAACALDSGCGGPIFVRRLGDG